MRRGSGLARFRVAIGFALVALYSSIFLGAFRAAPGVASLASDMQLMPAALRLAAALFDGALSAAIGAFAALAAEMALTIVAGRLYCSFLCPFGAFQDALIFLERRIGSIPSRARRTKTKTSGVPAAPPKAYVHAMAAIIILVSAIFGAPFLLGFTEPYSAFGKLVSGFGGPALDLAINGLASIGSIFGSYAIAFRDLGFDAAKLISAAAVLAILAGLSIRRRLSLPSIRSPGIFSSLGRNYCNSLCPTGALLRLASRKPLFGMRISASSCSGCGACARVCRASCISFASAGKGAPSVNESACVRCFECVGACPAKAISFGGPSVPPDSDRGAGAAEPPNELNVSANSNILFPPSIDRRALIRGATGLGAAALLSALGAAAAPSTRKPLALMNGYEREPAAPPGAGERNRFLSRCTACLTCASACPSGVIRSSSLEWGILDAGKPFLAYDKAYCQFECDLCLRACPTGALSPLALEIKKRTRIGKSVLLRERCIVVEKKTPCGACAEHCPTGAASMRIATPGGLPEPYIDEALCIGCGACETVCPAEPISAIRVEGRTIQDRAEALEERPGDSGDVQGKRADGSMTVRRPARAATETTAEKEPPNESGNEGFPF